MQIGKVTATERAPTTVDEFYFWTSKKLVLRPFDVITVKHLKGSMTFGVVEEISHITDSASSLAGFISSDFGDVDATTNTQRIGMNYVKARVVGNTGNIYTPVLDGSPVSLASEEDVKEALGLSRIKNPLPCGYIDMYEENTIRIPVHFNSHFLLGPEGAHLNISGISGLASKTSYAMFLLKSIQEEYMENVASHDDSVAFVILNVKGRDLLALDERNDDLTDNDKDIYEMLGVNPTPFSNVRYFYPYAKEPATATFAKEVFQEQKHLEKAYQYKYTFELDKDKIDMLFANIDDSSGTMESIVANIVSTKGEFANISDWNSFRDKLAEYKQKGDSGKDKEISVLSWRKFNRHFNRILEKSTIFNDNLSSGKGEVRLQEEIQKIRKNDVYVIDIAKLEDEIQGFVFGDVVNAIYDLKLGQNEERDEADIPSKIVIFIDELNKYASNDVPKNSPVLRRLLEVTERGRSLGIILFSVEQFRSVIHDRVKGNCSTNAFGRTNAIEVSKPDYRYIPSVFKSMMTRLEQGEYIIENPAFRADFLFEPGPLTKRDVLSIMPFNNQIVRLKMKGKLLRAALEHGVSRSAEDHEPGQFPQVSGISFTFDAAKPPGSRVTEVLVNRQPLKDDADYTMATSPFLFSGGDGYEMLKGAVMEGDLATAPREIAVFESAIRNSPKSTIAPKVGGRIVRIN